MSRFFKLAFFATMVLVIANTAMTEENAPQLKEETVAKSVLGTVSGISVNFIAVEYGVDEKGPALEVAFNVDKDVKIENKKSLKEIGLGDTVSVAYEEMTKTDEKGKMISSRRMAKKITFVRPAPKTAETTVLGSDTGK